MLTERTEYWAKPGQSAAVLEHRKHASAARLQLGLQAGVVRIGTNDDGPTVTWQCDFASEPEHAADLATRDSSEQFQAVREKMTSLIERFERRVERTAPDAEALSAGNVDGFDETPAFKAGVTLRKAVLGEAHVERSLANAQADPFMLPIQQLTTEFGWGTVWDRPGLTRKTRSFLSCSFLLALGRQEEFKTHVRGAINNGVTQEELIELIIQAGLYCGFPVALEGTRLAKSVLEQIAAEAAD